MSNNNEKKKIKLSVKFFPLLALSRYIKKKTDTFIIIYGKTRSGKTTLGLNFLIHYLKFCRRANRKGLIDFCPENSWKSIFKNYFAVSAEDMSKKIKKNPEASPVFIDESLDFLSWHDVLRKEQQDLIELLMKTGKKGMFTILITPSLSLLTKDLLARAHFMFLIPREFVGNKNKAIILRNYDNPILAEKNPFGIYSIIKKVEKHPKFFSNIENFVSLTKTQETFQGAITFRFVKQGIYNLYEKIVKEPLILGEKGKKRFILKSTYDKLKYMFQVILYNLKEKDGKTLAQIETLLTDKFGNTLLGRQTIAKYIEIIRMMEKEPSYEEIDESIREEIEKRTKKEEEIEDIKLFDEGADSLESDEEGDEEED